MSNITTTPEGFVKADTIVHTGLTTITKVIGAGAIAKATDSKVATVKAKHYAEQGAALALAAAVTGKGRAAAVAVYADAELSKLVNVHGQIDVYRAVATVARLIDESLTVSESVRADGQRIVKLSDWRALCETMQKTVDNPDTAKAKRNRYAAALTFANQINARSAFAREARQLAQTTTA